MFDYSDEVHVPSDTEDAKCRYPSLLKDAEKNTDQSDEDKESVKNMLK